MTDKHKLILETAVLVSKNVYLHQENVLVTVMPQHVVVNLGHDTVTVFPKDRKVTNKKVR